MSRIFLKRPGANRASWALVVGGKTVPSQELAEITRLFKTNTLPLKDCDLLAKKYLKEYRASQASQTSYSHYNYQLLERYWKHYGSKPRRDQRSAYNRLLRAVRALGNLSLQVTPREELQRLVSSLPAAKKRPVASSLNSLLIYAGRGDARVWLPPKEVPAPAYLTFEEVEKVLGRVRDKKQQLFFWAAFTTGARVGEVLAMRRVDAKGRVIVREQVRPDGSLSLRKNGKVARPEVIAEGRERLEEWLAIPLRGRHVPRTDLSKVMRKACAEAGTTSCHTHDLRHSYAVHQVSEGGKTLAEVADYLGDSFSVVRDYYINFAVFES